MNESRLGALVCATISTPDVAASAGAYQGLLGYSLRHQGKLAPELAGALAGPSAAGAAVAVLGPADPAAPSIRLIEVPRAPSFQPARSFGWSALEIVVQDVDALQNNLAATFDVIGRARDLDFSQGALRAMQALGPGGEILVFTQVNRALPGYDLPVAHSPVDRIFAAIQGCPDLDRTRDFFANKFYATAGKELSAAIVTVNDAFGLDRPTKHRLTTIALPRQGFIELDQYPDEGTRRQPVPGFPMPGICAVAFEVDSIDDFQLYWLGEVLALPEPPYLGRRHVSFYGGSGELIELIEKT